MSHQLVCLFPITALWIFPAPTKPQPSSQGATWLMIGMFFRIPEAQAVCPAVGSPESAVS